MNFLKSNIILLIALIVLTPQSCFSEAKSNIPQPAIKLDDLEHNIKAQLLNDEYFINSISNKIDKSLIENIVRNYFLQHPEFLTEIQQILANKEKERLNSHRTELLRSLKDSIYDEKKDLIIGKKDAKDQLIVFLDYNCGFCKKILQDSVAVVKNHPSLKIIVKELPILGQNSMDLAVISHIIHEIDPDKQKQFIMKLSATEHANNKASALKIASNIGIKAKSLQKKLAQLSDYEKAIVTNINLALQLRIQGTPTFIYDNKVIENVANLEELADKIEKGSL